MRDGPDDVFWPESGVAAEEDLRIGRLHGFRIDLGHVPAIELDAYVALDPGERVLLADCHEHVVALHMDMGLARRNERAPALGVVFGLHFFEKHARQAAADMREFLGHQEIEDRNAFVHCVFLFPGRGFHLLETGTHHDLDLVAAETPRGTAAIHRRIAAAQDDNAPAYFVGVAERDAGEPVYADVDVCAGFLASGNFELTPARRAATDKDRVMAFAEKRFHGIDALAQTQLGPQLEDVIYFFIEHGFRQAEFRDLRAHHSARAGIRIIEHAVIAQGQEIARHCERCGTRADQRDALAVFLRR